MRILGTTGTTLLRTIFLAAALFCGAASIQADLISHWTFDGDTEDSVGSNDGDFLGDVEPFYVEGFDGNDAIEFDGIDDIVIVQQNDSLPLYNHPEYSIAMWVKGGPQPDYRVWSEGSTTNNRPLFNIGTERRGNTGQVDLYIRDASNTERHRHTLSTGIAFDNSWHHIVWVDANGDAALYIDGVRDATDFSYVKPVLDLDTTTIGGILRGNPSHWFNGAIDDVRIYNHILSEDDVLDIMDPADDTGADVKPGDVNADRDFNISDPVQHLNFLFGGADLPDCYVVPDSDPVELTEAGFAMLDFNGDGKNNLTDPVAALSRLFRGGDAHALGDDCVRLAGSCETNCP